MKKIMFLIAVVAAGALLSFTVIKPHTDFYKVNVDSSSLEWYAEKVTGKHNGTIKLFSGDFSNNHGQYSGTFVVDMTSIKDKDMESEEHRTKLENHLKSADFFDAATYPKATFVMTSLTPLSGAKDGFTHSVKGNLTIKDKTNEVTFNASVRSEGAMVFATGSAIVDRAKFDIKYGSKTFFSDIGDKMIYDEFTLKFNIVAQKN